MRPICPVLSSSSPRSLVKLNPKSKPVPLTPTCCDSGTLESLGLDVYSSDQVEGDIRQPGSQNYCCSALPILRDEAALDLAARKQDSQDKIHPKAGSFLK